MLKTGITWTETEDLQLWDDDGCVFIKYDISEGQPMWLICDAGGEKIATAESREFAFIVARQNNLEPFSVH